MTNREYIEMLATQSSGIQAAYWTYIRRTYNEVSIEPMEHILSQAQIDAIKEYAFPKVRQCYKNAYKIAMLDDFLYVEGMVNFYGMPIEHAWNMTKDGRYFDATYELNGLEGGADYLSFYEAPFEDVSELALESRVYGGYPNQLFRKNHKEEIELCRIGK